MLLLRRQKGTLHAAGGAWGALCLTWAVVGGAQRVWVAGALRNPLWSCPTQHVETRLPYVVAQALLLGR